MLIYVKIDTDSGAATFRPPFNNGSVDRVPEVRSALNAIKAVPYGCRRWNPTLREWTITAAFWPQVHQALVNLGHSIELHRKAPK